MNSQRVVREYAQAAKLIRQDLKKAFPGVKFSVSSCGYSMGSSVTIDYENGPQSSEVNSLVKKYSYEGEYNLDGNRVHNRIEGLPQARFVFVQKYSGG
jgi:hypothetical protein